MDNLQTLELLTTKRKKLILEIEKNIIGQRDVIDHLFLSILCNSHVLIEGVPGLAKTLLIQTLSQAMDLKFSRIQFTPDLMPSDIIGTELIEENPDTGKREFKFYNGPIFSNIILADEINRTPPKTQSALLEAMQEKNVTTGGKTHSLGTSFFVFATQNPIEQEGTYPLPEAQLDRFIMNVLIDYPKFDDEVKIVKNKTGVENITINTIINKNDLLEFQNLVRNIPVSDNVIQFAVKLVNCTRVNSDYSLGSIKKLIDWGAGPRASMFLILAAKAFAAVQGKATPDIDDIKAMFKPILRHRIIPSFNADAEGMKKDDILDVVLKSSNS